MSKALVKQSRRALLRPAKQFLLKDLVQVKLTAVGCLYDRETNMVFNPFSKVKLTLKTTTTF